MNFFRRKPDPVQIRVIHSVSMRMDQWRASPELVAYAAELFRSPKFQTLLDVLRNESPASYGLGPGSTHDDQIAHAYQGTGYNLCLNNLEALATLLEGSNEPEAKFEPEGKMPLPPDAPAFTLPESRDKE